MSLLEELKDAQKIEQENEQEANEEVGNEKEKEEDLENVLNKLNADADEDLAEINVKPNDPPHVIAKEFLSAAGKGQVNVLKVLLEKGLVDVNCTNAKTKQTALHISCARGLLNCVEFLVKQEGIDLEPKDVYGNIPAALVEKGEFSAEILKLLETSDGEKGIVERYGEMPSLSSISGSFRYHVFLCHDYKNQARATTIKQSLEELGVKVAMTTSMMADASNVKASVDASKIILILSSKSFFGKISDPTTFNRSGCVMEMDSFASDRDVSHILIAALDVPSKSMEKWQECPDYEPVAEEGFIYDLSNDKALHENLPALYNEIKLRVTS